MYNAHTIFSQIKQDCQVYKNKNIKKKSVYTDIIECKYTFVHGNNLIYIIMLSNKHEK